MDNSTTAEPLCTYVACVFDADDIIELRVLPSGKSLFRKASELADCAESLTEFNGMGQNIYVGANPRKQSGGRKANDVSLARCLFADWDNIGVDEARRRWESAGLPEPTLILNSGHGIHCYWRLAEPFADLAEWTELQKSLIAAVESDPSIHDPPRVLRLPGFDNCKTSPRVPCYIVAADSTRRYRLDDLCQILAAYHAASNGVAPAEQADVQPARAQSHGATDDRISQCWGAIAKIPAVDKGDGSSRLLNVARQCTRYDLPNSDAVDLIERYQRAFPFKRPWAADDILRRLRDAEKNVTRGEALQSKASKKGRLVVIEPYTPFPVESLPPTVGRFVAEASSAIGCDTSFVALPILAELSRAIGNKRTIRLKRTWTEPPIIWGAIVGKSGAHKSPALKAAMAVLERKQSEAIARHVEALQKFEQQQANHQRDFAAWKRSKSTEPPPWEPKEPTCERFIVSDITIEALADRLSDQFDGVLVVCDELASWLDGIAEYKGGKGSDTGHWLASWSAAQWTVDRKTGTKKMISVPRATVSIIGGIQPGVLRRAIGKEHLQDGLCARLLLAMPEPRPVRWTEAVIDSATEAALSTAFDRLLGMEPALDAEGKPVPFAIPLTPEAKRVWIEYYNRHRAEQAGLDDDLSAAWSKLEAYTARFALIFQLCAWAAGDGSGETVEQGAVEAAVVLSDWFGNEARRVYGVLAESDEDREDRELVELIQRRGGKITARQLGETRRCYRASGAADEALERLVKAGIGKWLTEETGGRPATVFVLNSATGGNGTPELSDTNDPSASATDASLPETDSPDSASEAAPSGDGSEAGPNDPRPCDEADPYPDSEF